jgi:hypothetical protein
MGKMQLVFWQDQHENPVAQADRVLCVIGEGVVIRQFKG